MPVNGGDGRSGSMQYGVTREVGMGVPKGAQATMFATNDKSKKTANQKESQQTSQKKCKPTKNMSTKGHTTEIICVSSPNAKEVQQKAEEAHETSRNNKGKKTVNTSNKNATLQISLKKSKKDRNSTEQKQNIEALHIKCPNHTNSGAKCAGKSATPTRATEQTSGKKRACKKHLQNAILQAKKEGRT